MNPEEIGWKWGMGEKAAKFFSQPSSSNLSRPFEILERENKQENNTV